MGCPKNLVDSEVMLGIVSEEGYSVVSSPEKAEVIVVNTCSFIEDAKRESINTILDLAELKKKGTLKRLIVAGCLSQRYRTELRTLLPEVDAFVGTGQYHKLVSFIEERAEDNAGFSPPTYLHTDESPRVNSQPFFRAYLKISEGCLKRCSFCIIPTIRGDLRSRSIPSLVEEAKRLSDQGVVELNLIAQNLPDFGRDRRDGTTLAGLLRQLLRIESIEWFRLLYVYPDDFSEALLEILAGEPRICKYLDVPVQHVSDRILKAMNRPLSGKLVRERLMRLRERIPAISLRTALMVGFPGETEKEFAELRDFVGESRFDHLGAFKYSPEAGTASYSFPDPIPDPVKEQRLAEIMSLQRTISRAKLQERIGQTVPVLVERRSEESEFLLQGRHQGQAPDIDGHVLIRGGNAPIGKIVPVKLEKALDYDYVGIAP